MGRKKRGTNGNTRRTNGSTTRQAATATGRNANNQTLSIEEIGARVSSGITNMLQLALSDETCRKQQSLMMQWINITEKLYLNIIRIWGESGYIGLNARQNIECACLICAACDTDKVKGWYWHNRFQQHPNTAGETVEPAAVENTPAARMRLGLQVTLWQKLHESPHHQDVWLTLATLELDNSSAPASSSATKQKQDLQNFLREKMQKLSTRLQSHDDAMARMEGPGPATIGIFADAGGFTIKPEDNATSSSTSSSSKTRGQGPGHK